MDNVQDEIAFHNRYWKSNTEIITVINPRTEDYIFQVTSDVGIDTATGKPRSEPRTYRVPAGGEERFPGPIANVYLDQMTKLIAQDEEKFQFLIDWALREEYYKKLIVATEDLIHTFQPYPEYLEKSKEIVSEIPEEVPFAEAAAPKKMGRPPKATAEA